MRRQTNGVRPLHHNPSFNNGMVHSKQIMLKISQITPKNARNQCQISSLASLTTHGSSGDDLRQWNCKLQFLKSFQKNISTQQLLMKLNTFTTTTTAATTTIATTVANATTNAPATTTAATTTK